ncbi:MOSC domain-containing protein YiiM [Planococcus glaciei]|uniref:MOSC domain-containing protein n=1 Tax=Planococcus glaciei TaxID=459472 RepID=UPI000888373B|nr:MOSC domain-containing protein [Planococcus glaciei]SDH94245.1 MOSC domain-containing protein YiiM [Planococcus glaciei]
MRDFKKAKIHNLSVGMPKTLKYGNGKEMQSAIEKQAVERVFLAKEGFHGDQVADLKHHGGAERAVCIYPAEHYPLWEQEFQKTLPPATFGENLTVSGMLEQDVYIGDIFRVGEAIIQVTQGRVPCQTIDRRLEMTPLMKRMVKTGFTGYLCRVIEEGEIRADSDIELVESHPEQISVLYTNEVNFHRAKDIEAMTKILKVDALAEEWRKHFEKRLEKLTASR